MAAMPTGEIAPYRTRKTVELLLVIFASSIGLGAYLLTHLDIDGSLPAAWPVVTGIWFAIGLVAHAGVRFALPYADPIFLPIALLLTGLGLSMIHRIDLIPDPPRTDATTQLVWVVLGVVAFIATAFLARDYRRLRGYPYILFLVGLGLLLLPLTPLGVEINGSNIWIRIGRLSFQPAEVAKIVLSIAFAAYLAEKADVLREAGPRVFGLVLPRPRDLGPIGIMWGASLLVLVGQSDLGTSLLFFGLFVAMVYVATERPSWLAVGAVLFAAGAVFAYTQFAHVRVRMSSWLDPFSNYDRNYQVIQGQYGFAWGGMLGRGWGLGRPGLTPLAKSDFITAAIGEELGIVGLLAVLLLYGVIVVRGLKTAQTSTDPFAKLLAAGLSFVFAVQVFAIVGGVTRLLPLTGLTTPFMSQGGSSMLANWIVLGLILVISNHARRPRTPVQAQIDEGGVAELSSDATSVIHLPRRGFPGPRPEPKTATTPTEPDDDDGHAVRRRWSDEPTQVVAVPPDSAGAATQAIPSVDEATQAIPATTTRAGEDR